MCEGQAGELEGLDILYEKTCQICNVCGEQSEDRMLHPYHVMPCGSNELASHMRLWQFGSFQSNMENTQEALCIRFGGTDLGYNGLIFNSLHETRQNTGFQHGLVMLHVRRER